VDLLRQSQSRSIFEVVVKSDGLCSVLSAAADSLTGAPVFTILKELAGIVLRIKDTALSKVEDKLLAYQDGLSIKMANHRPGLGARHILSLPDGKERQQT
jgi:hypothetical protein